MKENEKRYDRKMVYRVWTEEEQEVFFTSKTEAERYVNLVNVMAGKEVAFMNVWRWEMLIEK